MRKSKNRKSVRSVFLIILSIVMILSSINLNQFFINSNNILNEDFFKDKDPINDTLLTSYASNHSDNGADIDVIFHQSYTNNSYNTHISNISNSNLFTTPGPIVTTFNSSYTEMTITDIYAPNKTIIVEDYAGVAWQDADDIYASFEVQGVGYIENISFYMIHTGGINPWQLVDIYLFEAEDDSSNLRPKDTSGTLIYSGLNVSNSAGWYTAINIHEPFNASVPENKTYFIYTDVLGLGTCNWRYSFDSDGQDYDDESIVLNSGETEIQYLASSLMDTIDLSLKVSVSPLNNTPRPQDINLTINNNAVVNSTVSYDNKGIVSTQNKGYSDSDGNIDFEVKASWWDVSCNITSVQINYTKTDISASSEFIVHGSGQEIFWNVTIDENVDWFDNRLEMSYINFTIPSQWNNISVFNGGVEQTITTTPSNSKTVTALNAGNGTHWYLNATSDNLLDSVHYIVDNILITDKTVNFTNTVHFNASFNTFINTDDGLINISVYSPNTNTLNFSMQNGTFSSGLNISLGDWNMPVSIPYGVHTVQLYWSNDTDAGFVEEQLTILGVTDLDVTFPAYIFNASDTFNITVYFNDTGKNTGILGTPISYQIGVGNVRTDAVGFDNGTYIIMIDCNDTDFNAYGPSDITINANKQYYHNQTQTESITILRETDLTILDPSGGASYVSGDIFNITVQFNDTFENIGILDFNITYSLNNNDPRGDNIYYCWEVGKYNISINCNDIQFEEYGSVDVVINASKQYHHNQSKTLNIVIKGETELTVGKIPEKSLYTSEETFNLTVYFRDTSRNSGISGATLKFILNGTTHSIFYYDNGDGYYNISIDCSDSWYSNYGWFNFTINSTKINYYSDDDSTYAYIEGQTILNKISPSTGNNYVIGEIFIVIVEYNDTVKGQGVSGATIGYSLDGSTYIVDENKTDHLDGTYSIEIYCNDFRFGEDYGWITILINASKLNHTESVTSFTFERQITTYVSNNSASLGPIERGQVVSFVFDYNDTNHNPIRNYNWSRISSYQGFNEAWINHDNGTYTLTLNSSDVDVSYSPFTYIFSISAFGNQTQIITLTITVTIIYTNIENVSYIPTIARNSGLNQTVFFYFNDTVNIKPVPGVDTDDVVVYDNDTGVIWNTGDFNWRLYDLWGNGTYMLDISLNGLDSGWYTLRLNASNYPNYDISITFITFYLRGNYTQINIISISDPGGVLTPSGIGNNYSSFVGSDISVDFNITDLENSNKVVLGEADIYIISYINIDDATSGILSNNFQFSYASPLYGTYSGSIDTSTLTETGYYVISITIVRLNYENVTFSFNLTIGSKYTVALQVEYRPNQVTAGGEFLIRFNATYFDGISWNILSGATIRVIPLFNGITTTGPFLNTTDSNGKADFTIIVLGTATSMNLTVELLSSYYHGDITIGLTSFTIIQPPGGGINPGDLLFYIIIIAIAVGAVAGAVSVYRGFIVPKKREKARILSEVKTIFDDAVNLEHILVLYKNSGMCIFFKSFGLEEIDPEMISGFLSAVSTFGKEMESQEMLNEITYGDKVLLLSDGEFVRVALVLGKNPSVPIRQNLKEFIVAFESSYAKILPTWRGNLKAYQDAGIIVDEILNTSIILPHEIKHSSSGVKSLKKPNSKDVLKIAQNLVADSERQYFFIGQLLTLATDKLDKDLAEIFVSIKELRDNKLLVPIEISAIEEKPISEQELNLIRQKVSQLTHLAPEVTEKLVNDIASIRSPAEREAFLVSLGEHQTIVSAPVKGGAAVIDSEKSAKKEIKGLLNKATKAEKQDDFTKALEIYHNAVVIASNYELAKLVDEINDLVRKATIHESEHKLHDYEEQAEKAVKTAKYKEAARLYQLASDMASQIFKLGRTDMTKEVKRLTNKSRECEKLGE